MKDRDLPVYVKRSPAYGKLLLSNRELDGVIASFDKFESYRDKVKKTFLDKRQKKVAMMKHQAMLIRKQTLQESLAKKNNV